jgi:lysophospholipase L1-like esterase
MESTPTQTRESASLYTRFARGLVKVLGVLVVALVLLETLPRLVQIPGLTDDDLKRRYLLPNTQRLDGHPYLAYRERPNWDSRLEDYAKPENFTQVHHNSLGFRGPETTWEKPAGVFRIVCVGGSSTYGHTESSDATTWPARLQAHLSSLRPDRKFEVINGGASGYSTFESLINLELRLVDFQPDLVIYYEGINDMRCSLYPDPVNDNIHWRAVWPVFRPSPFEAKFESSYLYLIWRRYFTSYLDQRATLGFSAIVNFDGKTYVNGKVDPYYLSNPPEQGFKNFQRNLVSIIAVSRAHGAAVLFATQAMRFSDIAAAESFQSQSAAIERMKQMIRDVAAERQVPLVDAAPVVESAAAAQVAAGGEDTMFKHEVHLLDAGSDLLAKTIADGIIAHQLVP